MFSASIPETLIPRQPEEMAAGNRQGKIAETAPFLQSDLKSSSREDLERLIYELRTCQNELKVQNEELLHTQKELQESKDKYFELYDFAPVGYISLSQDDVILEANLTFASLLKAQRCRLIGKKITQFIVPEDIIKYREHHARVFQDGLKHCCVLQLTKHIGGFVCAQIESVAITDRSREIKSCRSAVSDITEHRRSEERQRFLIAELDHRVKNMLNIVHSVSQQTLKSSKDVSSFKLAFESRLSALVQMHRLLTQNRWRGAGLGEVAEMALKPYSNQKVASICGPALTLSPKAVQSLSMAFHELATNAAKYGALASSSGTVELSWRIEEGADGRKLRITWDENGGAAIRQTPKQGFGTKLISMTIEYELSGRVIFDFRPAGLRCEMTIPLLDSICSQENDRNLATLGR